MTIEQTIKFLSMFPKDAEFGDFSGDFSTDECCYYENPKELRYGLRSCDDTLTKMFLKKFPEYLDEFGYRLDNKGCVVKDE